MSTRTLVLCKPDAVERGLVGEIVGRLERKGLTIVALELRTRPLGPRCVARRDTGLAFTSLMGGPS